MKPRLAEEGCRALTVVQTLATVMVLLSAGVQSGRAQFTFTTNGDSITITAYTGPGGVVAIPGVINGYPVTDIGEDAFAYVANLSSVTIPGSVTNIGADAFLGCASLTNILVNAANGWYTSVNGILFDWAQQTLIDYPAGLTNATYTIPYTVTSIGPEAFFNCYSLTSIGITNVTSIGELAFFECTGLTSVSVATNIYGKSITTSIGVEAFAFCTSLTNVLIAGSVTNIGVLAFAYCTNLTAADFQGNAPPDVGNAFYGDPDAIVYCLPGSTGWGTMFGDAPTVQETPPSQFYYIVNGNSIEILEYEGRNSVVIIPSSINGYPVTSIGAGTFTGSRVTSVTIPNSVNAIGYDAFENSENLTNIVIPNGVTNIGSQAFQNCESLTSVTIPDSVTSIGFSAFADCNRLTGVTIDNGVTSLDQTFEGCTNLTSVTIPSSVTYWDGAFGNCLSLTNVIIENGVTNIGMGSFGNCRSLTSVAIPNSVTSIGELAFYICTSLTNVTIGANVINIQAGAFRDCTSLTGITIPNSVTSIGDYAFESCTNLTSAYFEGNAPPDDGTVFTGDTNIVYYVPGTMGWGATFGGAPTALWFQPQPSILSFEPSFGVQNNQFGFLISWATNSSVVVQASTNLANPAWVPVATNALSNGTNYFSDAQWTNYPNRFYRLTAP